MLAASSHCRLRVLREDGGLPLVVRWRLDAKSHSAMKLHATAPRLANIHAARRRTRLQGDRIVGHYNGEPHLHERRVGALAPEPNRCLSNVPSAIDRSRNINTRSLIEASGMASGARSSPGKCWCRARDQDEPPRRRYQALGKI